MPAIDQVRQGGTIYEIVPEIAELFSTTKSYNVGDSVIYEAGLYTFKANKTAGSWDATKVDGPSKVTEKLDHLNGRLTQLSFDLGTDENGNVILIRSDRYGGINDVRS